MQSLYINVSDDSLLVIMFINYVFYFFAEKDFHCFIILPPCVHEHTCKLCKRTEHVF